MSLHTKLYRTVLNIHNRQRRVSCQMSQTLPSAEWRGRGGGSLRQRGVSLTSIGLLLAAPWPALRRTICVTHEPGKLEDDMLIRTLASHPSEAAWERAKSTSRVLRRMLGTLSVPVSLHVPLLALSVPGTVDARHTVFELYASLS